MRERWFASSVCRRSDPMTFGKQEEQIFLGREIAQHRDYSEHTAVAIDEEVRKFVMQGYDRAKTILRKIGKALVRIAEALLERESLDAAEIKLLIADSPSKNGVRPRWNRSLKNRLRYRRRVCGQLRFRRRSGPHRPKRLHNRNQRPSVFIMDGLFH